MRTTAGEAVGRGLARAGFRRVDAVHRILVVARTGGATTGYGAELWKMADALRGSMDAAEFKHVVLGLVFVKYISDMFEETRRKLVEEEWADPEDPDEYLAESVFWVPPEARWDRPQTRARRPDIGRIIDDAMVGIERENPTLLDVLPKDNARPALDRQRLGGLIDLVGNIKVGDEDALRLAASSPPSKPTSRAWASGMPDILKETIDPNREDRMVTHNLETGQVARLGEMIYRDRIRPLVEDSQIGAFVVIDVESGEYEIDKEDLPATQRLLQRHPRAVTYAVRVGYPAAYGLGGRLRSSEARKRKITGTGTGRDRFGLFEE